jgi:hypothetical protein
MKGRPVGEPNALALSRLRREGISGAVPTSMAVRAGNRKGHSKWTSALSRLLLTSHEYHSRAAASILGLRPTSLNLRIGRSATGGRGPRAKAFLGRCRVR